MQIFMLAGFAIAEVLKNIAPCIEIYPHATAKLLGVATKHKAKDDQAFVQLNAISKYSGWPSTEDDWKQVTNICKGPVHDKIDAYSAAWVASLSTSNRQALGEKSDEDVIWIPRLNDLFVHETNYDCTSRINAALTIGRQLKSKKSKAGSSDAEAVSNHKKLCPACKNYWFKRWPFGWDAHAAHKCAGIEESDITSRKHLYKERFLE
jgi:hypothetical protein